jgi:hypothetical protein
MYKNQRFFPLSFICIGKVKLLGQFKHFNGIRVMGILHRLFECLAGQKKRTPAEDKDNGFKLFDHRKGELNYFIWQKIVAEK